MGYLCNNYDKYPACFNKHFHRTYIATKEKKIPTILYMHVTCSDTMRQLNNPSKMGFNKMKKEYIHKHPKPDPCPTLIYG